MNKIRITKESGLCIVRDITTGRTNVATYYEDIDTDLLVVVRYDNNQYAVRHVIDFVTDEDLYEVYVSSGDVHCEVVGHVDMTVYNEAMKRDDRRRELRALMSERIAEIEEKLYFNMLADEDEEFAKLYKEYKEL